MENSPKITLSLKSKSDKLNHRKTQSEYTQNLITIKKSIRPLGLYDENYNIIENILIKLN